MKTTTAPTSAQTAMLELKKLYIEPTSRCNLACRTCIRNAWEEAAGDMAASTFARIVEGLRAFSPPPSVFFGGFGEPLSHPNIVEMVAQAKALGSAVELITNGTLLTEAVSRRMIAARLDALWVSIDGATPESYADVRLGAALPEVIANVERFRELRRAGPWQLPRPEIGIVFVAMKRNLSDLPEVLRLGSHLGASRFMVTNVLPYTAEMRAEVLYSRALSDIAFLPSPWLPSLNLPKMDMDEFTRGPLYQALRSGRNVAFAGVNLGGSNDRCPFVEGGTAAIAWDGAFSPCLPLLHNHVSYLDERERFSRRWVIGNVADRDLTDLWNAPEYGAFRGRVQAFDFAPCAVCGGCDLSRTNEEDCYGSGFPTCGGCLWAQGVIQCP
ncbi:MAG: radical SAM protein [Chloroflexi bacterium]|nr:radical SAM protein [Chloroflexota bacterium]